MTKLELLDRLTDEMPAAHPRLAGDTLYLEGSKFLTVDHGSVMFWRHGSTILTTPALVAVAKFADTFGITSKNHN